MKKNTHTIRATQALQNKDVRTNAERTFTYNILVPDFFIFAVIASAGFASLLAVFS